jgi:hypothetical protein
MTQTGWGEVINRALGLMAVEPIEIRILIGLAAAFALTMILAGLRATFLPASRARREAVRADPAIAVIRRIVEVVPAAQLQAVSGKPAARKTAPKTVAAAPGRMKLRLVQPKVVKATLKPYRGARPQIRRSLDTGNVTLMVTDEGAPYSPISPNIR